MEQDIPLSGPFNEGMHKLSFSNSLLLLVRKAKSIFMFRSKELKCVHTLVRMNVYAKMKLDPKNGRCICFSLLAQKAVSLA